MIVVSGPVAIPVAIFSSHPRTKATSSGGSVTCSRGTLRAEFRNVRKYVTASARRRGDSHCRRASNGCHVRFTPESAHMQPTSALGQKRTHALQQTERPPCGGLSPSHYCASVCHQEMLKRATAY